MGIGSTVVGGAIPRNQVDHAADLRTKGLFRPRMGDADRLLPERHARAIKSSSAEPYLRMVGSIRLGAELAETGTWGHGFHGIGFRWTPGHLDDPGDRAGGSMRGVARQRAGKPQIETRLLEQGPGVSALLTAGWVACLPSLDLPGCAPTVARRGDRGHRHSCLFCEQPLTGGAPARRCSLARCQPAPDWQP